MWAQDIEQKQLDVKAAIEKKADAEATAKAEKEAHINTHHIRMFES
jgi:hypothetical protein